MAYEGDGIYWVTMNLAKGKEVQYKFIRGTWWNGVETVPLECANGETNRYFTVPETNLVLPTVGYGICETISRYNITFSVDMSNEVVLPQEVHIAGNFTDAFWDPSANTLAHTGNDIYSVTLSLPQKLYKYKFVNGSTWEYVSPNCGVQNPDQPEYYDRAYLATTEPDQTVKTTPFSGCANINVTFIVDMTGITLATGGPHIVGGFPQSNWNPATLGLTQVGDNIYSVVLSLTPGYYTYKFLRGNYWGSEEVVPESCGVEGGVPNVYDRYIDVIGTVDITADIVLFGACAGFNILLDVPYSQEESEIFNGAACAKMILDYESTKHNHTIYYPVVRNKPELPGKYRG